MSDLTVCSVVYNDNDTKLFDLMVKSVLKFTDDQPKFIILDNGKNTLDKYRKMDNFTVVDGGNTKSFGSLQHGESLNKIFPLVDTKKTAILESDCIVLRKGWDYIDFPKYKMLAAKKGELAGRPYYHACFMVFSTGLLKHNGIIDFRPGKKGTRSNRSYKVHEDVCWQISEKINHREVYHAEFRDCKDGNGFFFDKSFQSDEFWVGGQPTIAHFGRGSNLKGKAIRKGFTNPRTQLKEWKKIAEGIINES